MGLSVEHVTVDAHDAGKLAHFWAQLLDRTVDPDANEFFATVGKTGGAHPVLMFIQVPDKTPGKNSIHLDLVADNRDEEVTRAVSLGAERLADYDEYGTRWTTLRDPEGNLFDIAGK